MSVKQALTIKAFSVLSIDLVCYIIQQMSEIRSGFLLFYLWCWMLVKVSLQIPLAVMSYKNATTEDDKFILIGVESRCSAFDLEDINENFFPCIFADCCSDFDLFLALTWWQKLGLAFCLCHFLNLLISSLMFDFF